jgi:hypothetical protein
MFSISITSCNNEQIRRIINLPYPTLVGEKNIKLGQEYKPMTYIINSDDELKLKFSDYSIKSIIPSKHGWLLNSGELKLLNTNTLKISTLNTKKDDYAFAIDDYIYRPAYTNIAIEHEDVECFDYINNNYVWRLTNMPQGKVYSYQEYLLYLCQYKFYVIEKETGIIKYGFESDNKLNYGFSRNYVWISMQDINLTYKYSIVDNIFTKIDNFSFLQMFEVADDICFQNSYTKFILFKINDEKITFDLKSTNDVYNYYIYAKSVNDNLIFYALKDKLIINDVDGLKTNQSIKLNSKSVFDVISFNIKERKKNSIWPNKYINNKCKIKFYNNIQFTHIMNTEFILQDMDSNNNKIINIQNWQVGTEVSNRLGFDNDILWLDSNGMLIKKCNTYEYRK